MVTTRLNPGLGSYQNSQNNGEAYCMISRCKSSSKCLSLIPLFKSDFKLSKTASSFERNILKNGQGGVHMINPSMPRGLSSMYKHYATSIFSKSLTENTSSLCETGYNLNIIDNEEIDVDGENDDDDDEAENLSLESDFDEASD